MAITHGCNPTSPLPNSSWGLPTTAQKTPPKTPVRVEAPENQAGLLKVRPAQTILHQLSPSGGWQSPGTPSNKVVLSTHLSITWIRAAPAAFPARRAAR